MHIFCRFHGNQIWFYNWQGVFLPGGSQKEWGKGWVIGVQPQLKRFGSRHRTTLLFLFVFFYKRKNMNWLVKVEVFLFLFAGLDLPQVRQDKDIWRSSCCLKIKLLFFVCRVDYRRFSASPRAFRLRGWGKRGNIPTSPCASRGKCEAPFLGWTSS